ncbi:uncharacterized protein LOC114337285 isoform X2 [Diabrotica virgifera virgifera]|uniref:Uncharacterized protein LOC114337285 n=1 Tax=Diabrotica virgifera virgifera TaxID=50390 RepID=A0A6P7G9G0_DIAVI|nr:uncharacterized protein LOC114337285 isoform X2 [Diabrotica virgifera virgifera]
MSKYMEILNFLFPNQNNGIFKIILMLHFTLSILGAMGSSASNIYVFYNFLIIIMILWSTREKENMELLRLVVALEICACLIDLFYLITLIHEVHQYVSFRGIISAITSLLNWISRPIIVSYIIRINNTQENESLSEDFENSRFQSAKKSSLRFESEKRDSIQNNPFESQYFAVSSQDDTHK